MKTSIKKPVSGNIKSGAGAKKQITIKGRSGASKRTFQERFYGAIDILRATEEESLNSISAITERILQRS